MNSQNKKLVKETFFKQSVNEIEKIAIKSGFKGGDFLQLKVFFKIDSNGEIFDINLNNRTKAFESEIIRIINQIPRLDPNEYLTKGQEMKYELKINIKLPTNRERKKRIKKGTTDKIEYKGFYVKEYFPVKWIEIKDTEKSEFSKIETIPVTKKCKKLSNENEIRSCVIKDIQKYVTRKFDVDLAQDLGLPQGKQRIIISFVISKSGEIVNVEAKGSHKLLLDEGTRVINSFPSFYKPGTIGGEPVNVNYKIPLSFMVQ